MRTGSAAVIRALVVVGLGALAPTCSGLGEEKDRASVGPDTPRGPTGEPPATTTPPPPDHHDAMRAPRLLAPLSGAISTSSRPALRWFPGGAAGRTDVSERVQICSDRACSSIIATLEGSAGSARPESPLPAGVLFWQVVASSPAGHHARSATWSLVIGGRQTDRATTWGTVPDFNGDGLADVAVGAPAGGAPYSSEGRVFVYHGARGPLAEPLVIGGGPGFGRGVGAIGDVNGDGYGDLAVAEGEAPGAVRVLLGGTSGLRFATFLDTEGRITASFGDTIASAGDIDGDGYGDIIVGGREAGQVYRGGPDGPSAEFVARLTGRDFVSASEPPGAERVQGPADINGDGGPDLLVGTTAFTVLYLKDPLGWITRSELGFSGGIASLVGFAGDMNNDGFADMTLQAVVPGTPSGPDLTGGFLLLQAGESFFGAAGDLDGDGFTDAFAALTPIEGFPERERVYFGDPGSCGDTGCRPHVALVIPGHDFSTASQPAIIAATGDLNGDGLDDVVATTPETGLGYVFLSQGRSLGSHPAIIGHGTGAFGASVTCLLGTAPRLP